MTRPSSLAGKAATRRPFYQPRGDSFGWSIDYRPPEKKRLTSGRITTATPSAYNAFAVIPVGVVSPTLHVVIAPHVAGPFSSLSGKGDALMRSHAQGLLKPGIKRSQNAALTVPYVVAGL